MEGWNEDDNECTGLCGLCDTCIDSCEMILDLEYDDLNMEENNKGLQLNEIK